MKHNIVDQLQDEKIVRTLSNKFCIAVVPCTNGCYDGKITILGLDKGKIYSYGSPYKNNIKDFVAHEKTRINSMPNTTREVVFYKTGLGRAKTFDYRRCKKQARRLVRLLENQPELTAQERLLLNSPYNSITKN